MWRVSATQPQGVHRGAVGLVVSQGSSEHGFEIGTVGKAVSLENQVGYLLTHEQRPVGSGKDYLVEHGDVTRQRKVSRGPQEGAT